MLSIWPPESAAEFQTILSSIELVVSTILTIALIFLYNGLKQSQERQNRIQETQTRIMELSRQANLEITSIEFETQEDDTDGHLDKIVKIGINNIGEDIAISPRLYIYCEDISDKSNRLYDNEDNEKEIISQIEDNISHYPGVPLKSQSDTAGNSTIISSREHGEFTAPAYVTPGSRVGMTVNRFIDKKEPSWIRVTFAISYKNRFEEEQYEYAESREAKITSDSQDIHEIIEDPMLTHFMSSKGPILISRI